MPKNKKKKELSPESKHLTFRTIGDAIEEGIETEKKTREDKEKKNKKGKKHETK